MNAPVEIKKTKEEAPAELESQIILRLPGQVSAALRAAVRSGVMNLKDRLTIQLEPDNRHGIVRFDRWTLSARVLDLPSIIESHKTLDRKTFYKTADVAQIMVCKEDDGGEDEEARKAAAAAQDDEESPRKKERRDAKDKKYQHPHGITPSLKNVRKRRFRKVLKKKYVDFPEIEKEVKRLFRMDNEAIGIRYEVVNADDDKGGDGKGAAGSGEPHVSGSFGSPSVSAFLNSNSQSMDVGEHDLFGEALSSSDEDDVNIVDSGGEEHLPSRLPKQGHHASPGKRDISSSSPDMVTHFQRGMLATASDKMAAGASTSAAATAAATSSLVDEYVDDPDYGEEKEEVMDFTTTKKDEEDDLDEPERDNSALLNRLTELEREIAQLQDRRQAQELEIASIENQALKQRFQNIVNALKSEESSKQREYDEIVSLLHQ